MAGCPKVRISKYFGSANIQQLVMDIDEAKGNLEYFWTPEGGHNIIVSVDGQTIKSFDELRSLASLDRYKNNAYIDVGLFLSNDGTKSIWPK